MEPYGRRPRDLYVTEFRKYSLCHICAVRREAKLKRYLIDTSTFLYVVLPSVRAGNRRDRIYNRTLQEYVGCTDGGSHYDAEGR